MNGRTRNGEAVSNIGEHLGLLRGYVVTGQDREGNLVRRSRFWYPDGRMTPARQTPFDLLDWETQ